MEGNGLSISKHPKEWQKIARLSGATHKLSRAKGAFLQYRKLSALALSQITKWAENEGLLAELPRYRLEWFDSELNDTMFVLLKDKDRAEEELSELDEAQVKIVQIWCATDKMAARLGFAPDDMCALEMAACAWVEDCTNLNGVWWADKLDVLNLSAPRGVINLKSLPLWAVFKDASI